MKALSPRSAVAAAVVLGANAVIMSEELLATRLLFPRFGNTVFTWSAVISIIIAGLFLGYMGGGVLAERRRDRWTLVAAELLAGGLLAACVPWLCDLLLVAPRGEPPLYPPLLGCFVVFGLPAACLAAVPPAAVGLLVEEGRGAAWSSGAVSALSAAGSIAGTLGTTFSLIPHFGVRPLFVAYGVGLGALALLARLLGRSASGVQGAAVAALYALGLAGAARADAHPPRTTAVDPVYRKDSAYQLVRVFDDQKSGVRLLMLDSTQEGAMRMADKGVVFDYTRAYKIFPNAFGTGAGRRVLFIGGGAYTMPVRTALELPRAQVEVAEVDPLVRDVAARYFGASDVANLSTTPADGRQALRGRQRAYDGIFIDAYQGVYAIPFHLTTREFFESVQRALKPGGLVALNLIGSISERQGFLCSVAQTMAAVFPRVELYPTRGFDEWSQNVIIVAGSRRGALDRDLLRGAGFSKRVDAQGLACRSGAPLLTDDFAPAEWLVARYLLTER